VITQERLKELFDYDLETGWFTIALAVVVRSWRACWLTLQVMSKAIGVLQLIMKESMNTKLLGFTFMVNGLMK